MPKKSYFLMKKRLKKYATAVMKMVEAGVAVEAGEPKAVATVSMTVKKKVVVMIMTLKGQKILLITTTLTSNFRGDGTRPSHKSYSRRAIQVRKRITT